MTQTTVTVDYLGRAVAVRPAVFGQMFEDHCTVNRVTHVEEWVLDPPDPITGVSTGRKHLQRSTQTDPIRMWWYAQEGATFCAYSGYGPHIEVDLRKRGIEPVIKTLVDDGLGAPNLAALAGVMWRPRQKEVFVKLLANKRGVIICPTAFGKTFLIKLLAKVYPKAQIGITVASVDVCKDMYDELKYELGGQLGMLGGGRNVINRVNIVVSQSLHKLPKDINLLLADECHELLTVNYVKMFNKFRRARLFGFTASPDARSDKADGLAEAVFGPQLIDVGYQEGVAAGNIVQLNVRMYRCPFGPNVSGSQVPQYKVSRLGIWQNTGRNLLIAKIVRQLEQQELAPEDQVLVMVDTAEHAYLLGQLLPDYTIVSGEVDPSRALKLQKDGLMLPTQELCTAKLRDKYRKAFESYELKRVISTKVWRKGVDFRDLSVLVRADGLASGTDAVQIPGRLSRLAKKSDKTSGLLIDFLDDFSKNLKGRSLARHRVYKDKGWFIDIREPPA